MSGLEKTPPRNSGPTHSRNSSHSSRHSHMHSRDWEIMEDLQSELSTGSEHLQELSVPGLCEGFLMKKRKWPLNGWHKRYFVLEKGILRYGKTQQDVQRGKIHGSVDVSLAVMSVNKKSKRIDLDAGDNLYHMKAKREEIFYIWLTKLSAHRIFKKNEAIHAHQGVLHALSVGNGLPTIASLAQRNRVLPDMYPSSTSLYRMETLREDEPAGMTNKVSAWLEQNRESDQCAQELARCKMDLEELNQLVQKLNQLENSWPITSNELGHRISMQNLTLEKPKKKSGKIWGHSRTLSGVETGVFTSSHLRTSSTLGASLQSIPDYVYSQLSTPAVTSPEGRKIQQDICNVSQRLHTSLSSVFQALVQEREKLQQVWTGPDFRQATSHRLASLCTTLSEMEVQSRLTKVHSLSSSDSSDESFCTVRQEQPTPSLSRHPMRTPSLAESAAEYFDASEVLNCESSSENEASDESGLSDVTTSNSDPEELHAPVATVVYRSSISRADLPRALRADTGHRTALPAPCPDNSHIGLMTILYNNIGKDLSRVSMPVALNEPLCLLQRMCEDLEYSDLLDTASHTPDPYERMVYIAAFVISGYAWATYRNRYKPFNPVLGETYECVQEERGFRYVSEQVSHHPPISACHAESENFTFWQDQRFKNKFWGKSLEIIPTGMVNVTLPKFGDHYEWNKVVTCIHNVLSQQRWLEHYGEVLIRNINSTVCTCKMVFMKSRSWGSDNNVNEVQGQVLNEAGEVVHHFGGFWHEGIVCDTLPVPKCIWKPNPQPKNSYDYYGFSRMAMELNELIPEKQSMLPPTDTRFRPDQRLLEGGKVSEADKCKDEVEEKQRRRRKLLAKMGEEHVPRFFTKTLDKAGREVWVTNGTYWKIREEPGFASTENLDLWRTDQ
ncbi:oxysterol-binding protein-related protein 6-like [Scleropages formosus]|uniref:Oxysterol-binding protein n=1 Tax=Scleropages formosus TaxID=113540 RepID=A0A8C9UYY8_SCLFO|nr:oxysterol-binding protein-related protein 6-like [Scleropages formosus]XP_018612367.1 oxysterol-binding protein-related protein 6-like [Scleropages formosus]XP_029109775.1 oxysterol-binding protein-related protein 6-like [Scleropages formosus]